jgi:tetratricopeptide (TPR) repeat protein
MQLNEFDKALADHGEAIRIGPTTALFWNNRSVAHLRMKQPAKALADSDKAIELDSKFAPAWFNRGAACQQLGDWEKAADAYLTSLRLGTLPPPDVPLARNGFDDALKELERNQPGNGNLSRLRAEAAMLKGPAKK